MCITMPETVSYSADIFVLAAIRQECIDSSCRVFVLHQIRVAVPNRLSELFVCF
jgi:hypothetical protein